MSEATISLLGEEPPGGASVETQLLILTAYRRRLAGYLNLNVTSPDAR